MSELLKDARVFVSLSTGKVFETKLDVIAETGFEQSQFETYIVIEFVFVQVCVHCDVWADYYSKYLLIAIE